ncbi:MAG TPA: MFS transporter [Candidatus Fimivicinus intestinavium]|nr:MFS transporter [Candidatus Fimivicinus intestinavium]
MKLIEQVKHFLTTAATYWKKPPEGRYMTYKEILSLAVGGFGAKFLIWAGPQLMISVGNAFICNTVGIGPMPVYVIWLLSILSSFPLTALRARMIDNTRSMKGKYRPYIFSMGLPTALLGVLYVWFPYEKVGTLTTYVFVLLINIALQFFYNFFNDAYTSLVNVLSPNTIERSDVISVKSVVENLAPSICSFVMPLAARAITGENTLYDMRVYRVLFPLFFIAGFTISMLIYVNTEEKIVQAKTHVIQVKFIDAFKAVAKNKYFWVISLAGWIGFLEGASGSLIGWMYNYQQVCTATQYSIITLITGNASFWPMLLAPYFIRKYGKKRILLTTNLLNVLFFSFMAPVVRQTGASWIIWALTICICANNFITTLSNLLVTGINADVRDYQQYITGERIDGMFSAVGLIGTVISLATSFVLPTLYDRAGLNETVALSLGYDGSNVYDVLYDPGYFAQISTVLVAASIIGAIMNVIPYFFYDLTETRQKAIVAVLKIRALFEDYGNHVLREDKMAEAVEIIREAQAYAHREPSPVSKDGIRAARKTHDKEQVKAARKAHRKAMEENEKIEIARLVDLELHRFDTPEGKAELENARRMIAAGLDGFLQVSIPTKAQAKAMPKSTQQEKDRRRDALILAEKMKSARKAIQKYFPDGIEVFDSAVFDTLFEAEDQNELAIHDAILELKGAREQKNTAEIERLKAQLKQLHAEKVQLRRSIQEATDRHSIYYRAAQPYLDAQKLLTQQENYTHLDEILARYETYAASKAVSSAPQV